MGLKKLFTNYETFVSQMISRWQSELDKAQSLGNDYAKSLVSLSEEYDYHRMSTSTPQELEQEILKCFEVHSQNIQWLKSFLLDNLSLSQIEPVYMTYQGHCWYINAFKSYLSFILERRLLEGEERHGQSFYEYPHLRSKEAVEHLWLYQDAVYGYSGLFSLDEQKLLVLDYADKERRKFEKLKRRFSGKETDEIKYERARIPEEVRIAVWRRDQGKCARCGNRENLEYDHIVPVSKGGGNTVRNIELLCQNCNRSKGNRIE